jgi:insulysin
MADESSSTAGSTEQIETPSVDKREYKHMTLGGGNGNGNSSSKLQVLLISDPDTDKSSAAMDIGIGQLCDGDLPGIAHFSEHMLFIGTTKYPDENAYDSFLNAHGGSSNAFTDLEHTCYYFDVQAESLEGAFDRFAQCFIGPLFTKAALEREVQAVDSEHAKNLMQDQWRMHQLSKSKIAPPDHPYGSFGSGNAESLPTVTTGSSSNKTENDTTSDDNTNTNTTTTTSTSTSTTTTTPEDEKENDSGTHIREQLLDFFEKYYRRSLEIYKLVVLGKESVADLEAMVQRYFGELIELFDEKASKDEGSAVITTTPETTTYDDILRDLYPGPESWIVPQRLHVVPISQVHSLELEFPMREIKSLYRCKPTRYLSHLLGHEGSGSLLSLLKSKQYATDLYADDGSKSCAAFSIFTIKMELTEDGLANVDEIVSMVFAYMDLLRSIGPQEWIHTEAQTVSDMQFRFLSQRNPMDYTCSVAGYMQQYPPEQYLSGAYKTFDWDASLVTECLESLVPENVFMMVSSPTFESSGENAADNNGTTDEKKESHETEKWYGTKYNTIEPNEALWKEWKSIHHDVYPALKLPLVNDMIATDFEVLEPSTKESSFPKDKPQCIHQDGNVRLWYKPDNVFDMPKVNIMYRFSSGQGAFSPDAIVAAQLFTELVTEQCNEFSYEATMAGLYCQISPSPSGLELQVSGYNHKVHVLVERLLDTTMDLLSDTDGDGSANLSELFDRVTFKLEQAFQSFLVGQPYQHCIYAGDLVLEQRTKIEDKMNVLKEITLPEVLTFARGFLKHCHLEGLVHGNVSAQHAYDITRMVWSKTHPLQTNSLEATITRAPLEKRVVQLSGGTNGGSSSSTPSFLYRMPEFNEADTNSCVEIILQMGILDFEANSTLALLSHLIREPAFNQLRTEEQLGYIVHSSIKTSGDHIKGLLILIQSDSFNPYHVEERIEIFLANFRQRIVDMPESDFQTFVDTVVASFLEKVRQFCLDIVYSVCVCVPIRRANFVLTLFPFASLLTLSLFPHSVLLFCSSLSCFLSIRTKTSVKNRLGTGTSF